MGLVGGEHGGDAATGQDSEEEGRKTGRGERKTRKKLEWGAGRQLKAIRREEEREVFIVNYKG